MCVKADRIFLLAVLYAFNSNHFLQLIFHTCHPERVRADTPDCFKQAERDQVADTSKDGAHARARAEGDPVFRNSMQGGDEPEVKKGVDADHDAYCIQQTETWSRRLLVQVLIVADVWLVPIILLFITAWLILFRS